ncbi:MAG TPA: carbamoyltransferase HypF [Polyangiaceae bacterium]|nr:carbamoyltransferase HypF [Polyangiaceae bacterium]
MPRFHLVAYGTVQGVGFRPFVYREAVRHEIVGWVKNTSGRVEIEGQGSREAVEAWMLALAAAPLPACVTALERVELAEREEASFAILESSPSGPSLVSIPADLGPCLECTRELSDPTSRRHGYPFTACSRCGPRYSAIQRLPYDREGTTLREFPLCAACLREYHDARDRRFHAETMACPECGPELELLDRAGQRECRGASALDRSLEILAGGLVLALRGVGGFQLLVDATNELAVRRLRERKGREEKPFAVLFASLAELERYAQLNPAEAALLDSPEGPIVLLERGVGSELSIASGVAPANPWLGCMLPSSPLHRSLAERAGRPLVCTSGNRSGEPLCVESADAIARLGGIADAYLSHNRPIARPLDDSVTRVGCSGPVILRRARGYAPRPVARLSTDKTILALGAQLKSSVALARNAELVLSQHIGDLDDSRTLFAFERCIEDMLAFFKATPDVIACDLHPDFASTRAAEELARRFEVSLVRVQHHYAHVAAVMAEYALTEPVLGIAWDGMGLGSDGTLWGGEFLLVQSGVAQRFAHFSSFPLPGGDLAAQEPYRSALGVLCAVDPSSIEEFGQRWLPPGKLRVLRSAMERGLNAPLTSSIGRLFDAVAAIAGLRSVASFEGCAAMELEFAAEGSLGAPYSLPLRAACAPAAPFICDIAPLVRELIEDVAHHAPRKLISSRFHAALVASAVQVAERAAAEIVVLSGGCFQNHLLVTSLTAALESRGHRVFTGRQIPCNDGGVAAGQAYAAALRAQV